MEYDFDELLKQADANLHIPLSPIVLRDFIAVVDRVAPHVHLDVISPYSIAFVYRSEHLVSSIRMAWWIDSRPSHLFDEFIRKAQCRCHHCGCMSILGCCSLCLEER